MSADRLFQIIYLLMNHKSMTATELAEHFEVSVRTIYRDIDKLSEAGIPVYTIQGNGGGIALLDTFVLDKTLLSKTEQKQILLAVQNLAIAPVDQEKLLAKLRALFHQTETDWLTIDLSRWGNSEADTRKFDLLKNSVIHKKYLTFSYVNQRGEEAQRKVKPVRLLFKSRSWYLQAYCMKRNEFRTFKVNRMLRLSMQEDTFDDVFDAIPVEKQESNQEYVHLLLRFPKEEAYRVYDIFDEAVVEESNHTLLVSVNIPEDEWLYSFLLSFGSKAEIIEPLRIRRILLEEAEKMLKNLSEPDRG